MKTVFIFFLLVITVSKIEAQNQCKDCSNRKIFGQPNVNDWDFADAFADMNQISENKFPDSIHSIINKSIINYYSKRFFDSCTLYQINYRPLIDESKIAYRLYYILKISNNLHYKLALNFDTNGMIFTNTLPLVNDSTWFKLKISCCNAINLALKDKKNPIIKIGSVDLRNISTKEFTGFVWAIFSPVSKPDKKGNSKQILKAIDALTGKVIMRDVIIYNSPMIIEDELFIEKNEMKQRNL